MKTKVCKVVYKLKQKRQKEILFMGTLLNSNVKLISENTKWKNQEVNYFYVLGTELGRRF